jgi:hypothetical protein
MGAMHDNIPCKVTMELSAFPDEVSKTGVSEKAKARERE